MADMQFKCKTCGTPLDALAAASRNGLVECPACFNVWTIPRREASPAAISFLRMGEHGLDTCKFDEAYSAYAKAAELDGKEPEAYFGMALATFKVQFLKDEVNRRMQPICHEISDESFLDDKNFRRALGLATEEQKREYRKRGREIDEVKEEFYALQRKGVDYDCFLCAKVTEGDGKDGEKRTADYERANDIYYYLKDKGYKPFFSEREMKGRTGSDYEALILYALYRSECMLIVCSNESYLQTKWVKNEYTRFLHMLANEEKERDALTFVFSGKPIEKLPSGKKVQGIDLTRPDAYTRIEDFVQKHTPEARRRREEQAAQKRAEEEARDRELAEMRAKLKQMEEERANAGNVSSEQLLAMMRKAEEEERKRREEEERKREEAERKRREEEKRIAAEQRARAEEEKKKREAEEAYLMQFQIRNGVLMNYFGKGGDVVLGDGVTAIGDRAFARADALTSISIPSGVTSIGVRSFSGCKNLTRIQIPDGVKSIGEYAFDWCEGLTSITIPKSVATIKDGTFNGCKGLTSVQIPNGVTSIGRSAFEQCSSLTSVTLPEGMTSIEACTFWECGGLTSIRIPKGVTSIGDSAFYKCSKLKSIQIPQGVTSIGCSAFQECDGLTSIIIPNSVISIGKFAFGDCKGLTSVVIPILFKGTLNSGLKRIFGQNYKKIDFVFTE